MAHTLERRRAIKEEFDLLLCFARALPDVRRQALCGKLLWIEAELMHDAGHTLRTHEKI